MMTLCAMEMEGSATRMRVMYDCQTFSNNGKSGISRYFVELALRLSGFEGVRLEVVAPLSRSPFLSEQRRNFTTVGLDLAHVPMAPRLPDRAMQFINRSLFRVYARSVNPDIVHETYYAAKPTAPKGSRLVSTVHDAIQERVYGSNPALADHHVLMQNVYSRADRLICVSQSTRNDLLDLYRVDPDRVSVVPLASSLSPPSAGPIDIGQPYFLHVGNRYPHKNFLRIIQAFGTAKLYRTHKLVSFSGSPWSIDELRQMKISGVPESAMKLASGDDAVLARFYAGADALVFPSLYEGFGIPVIEAMRVGCAVITSNISSLPEVAGPAAIYVEPRDSDDIANALMKLVSARETRSQLVEKGLARAQHFSWEKCAAETHAIYRSLLS